MAVSQTCSGTTILTESSGIFSDGSGSDYYDEDLACYWLIQVAEGDFINLSCNFISVGLSDWLYIFDGADVSAPLIGSFWGTNTFPDVFSSGNELLVYFNTDPSGLSQGWELEYHSCSGLISPPVITLSDSVDCVENNVTLTSDFASDITWSTGDITQSINVQEEGQYWISHLVDDCIYTSDTIMVEDWRIHSDIYSSSSYACPGGQIQLLALETIFEADFDDPGYEEGYDEDFLIVENGDITSVCGSVSGNACHFEESGNREIRTTYLDLTGADVVTFYLKIAEDESQPCLGGGYSFINLKYRSFPDSETTIDQYVYGNYGEFTKVSVLLPDDAKTSQTRLIWRQGNGAWVGEEWAIDNIEISRIADDFTCTWSSPENLSDISIYNPVATIVEDEMFFVEMTNGFCTVVDSVSIYTIESPETLVEVFGDTIFCENGSVTLGGPDDAVGYLWSTQESTQEIIVDSTGSYSLTVDYGLNCITTSPEVTVLVHPNPDSYITLETDSIICGSSVPLMYAPLNEYYQYQWYNESLPIEGENSSEYSAAVHGYYTVEITDTNNCSSISEQQIIQNLNPVFELNTNTTSACSGGIASLSIVPTGFFEDFNDSIPEEWEVVAGALSDVCGSVDGLALRFSGGSSRWVTTQAFNTLTSTSISFYLQLSESTDSQCEAFNNGDKVTLRYFLDDNTSEVIANFYPEFIDGNLNLYTIPLPAGAQTESTRFRWGQATSPSNQDIWILDNIYLNSMNETYDVIWSPSDGLTTTSGLNTEAEIISDIVYTATVSNSNCTVSNTVEIDLVEPPQTNIESTGPVLCMGGELNLSTIEAVSYLWSTGDTTQQITINTEGIYSITSDYGFGCTNTSDPFEVVLVPLPEVSISMPQGGVLCNGNEVLLSADGDTAANYQWIRNEIPVAESANSQYTTEIPGEFHVVVTDSNLCTNSSSPVSIPDHTPTVYFTTASNEVCAGGSTQIFTSSESIIEDFDPIDDSAWIITGGSVSNTCGSVSGSALFFDGGISRSAVTIPVKTYLGGSLSFYLKISDGILPCDAPEESENVILEYSVDGTNFYVLNTYEPGEYPEFTLINEYIPYSAQSIHTKFRWRQINFQGNQDNWAIDNVSINSVDDYSFLWSPSEGLSSTTDPEPVATLTESVSYYVQVVNSGCMQDEIIPIEVITSPPAIIYPEGLVELCEGLEMDLTATTGITYLWSNGDTTQSISVANSGIYSVTVDFGFGCTSSDNSAVTIIPGIIPEITYESDLEVCGESEFTLQANTGPGYEYAWFFGDFMYNNSNFPSMTFHDGAGAYSVAITLLNDCVYRDTVYTTDLVPEFEIGSDDTFLCQGDTTQLISVFDPDYIYEWSPSTGVLSGNVYNPFIAPLVSTDYTLTVTNQWCSDSTMISIEVNDYEAIFVTEDASCSTCCDGNVITLIINGESGDTENWVPWPNGMDEDYNSNVVCPGEYIFEAENEGCLYEYSIVISYPESLVEMDSVKFTTYPNPVTDLLYVVLDKSYDQSRVSLFDPSGRRLFESEISGIYEVVDVSFLAAGIYYLVFEYEGRSLAAQKVIVN